MADPLGLRGFGASSRERFTDAATQQALARARALAQLAEMGVLTGDQGAGERPAAMALAQRSVSGDTQRGGIGDAWSAWWDALPGIVEGRASGLAAAGQAELEQAMKDRRKDGGSSGGGGGRAAAPSYVGGGYLDLDAAGRAAMRAIQNSNRPHLQAGIRPMQYDKYGRPTGVVNKSRGGGGVAKVS